MNAYEKMLKKAENEWSKLLRKLAAANAAIRNMYESGVALQ